MAENKLLNVRINHKFDTYANWMKSSIVLGAGELAVALIANATGDNAGNGLTPPTIGVKIGDGSKTFAQLDWIQAIAGDVHPWAKKETLEFADLSEDFKTSLGGFIGEEIQDTNTQYTFEYSGDILTIKRYEKGQTNPEDFETVATITIADSTKISKVESATAGNLPALTADGSLTDSGEKISDYLKTVDADLAYAPIALEETVSGLSDRVAALDTATTGRVSVLESKMDVLNGEAEGSVKKQVADAIAGVVASAPEDFDTLKEIADYISSDKTGAAELSNRVAANETAIAKLEEVALSQTAFEALNTVTAEDVASWKAAEQNAKDYTDGLINTEKEAREAVAERVTTLEGVVGDETSGLVADVAAHDGAITALEEKSHEHANKEVLDGITEAKVTAWDAAIQAGNGIEVTTTDGKSVVSNVSTDLLKTGANELILECGGSGVA